MERTLSLRTIVTRDDSDESDTSENDIETILTQAINPLQVSDVQGGSVALRIVIPRSPVN